MVGPLFTAEQHGIARLHERRRDPRPLSHAVLGADENGGTLTALLLRMSAAGWGGSRHPPAPKLPRR